MDFHAHRPPSAHHDYSQLSDDQLRSAIRFAEKRIRWVQEDHTQLVRAYCTELAAMRRHLFDRILDHMLVRSAPLSTEQAQELQRLFDLRGLKPAEIATLIRCASRGRTAGLDGLSELEAMALQFRLERDG